MRKADSAAVEWIIADTIYEKARLDPDGLASCIVGALAEAGYCIIPEKGMEASLPRSDQELMPDMRSQEASPDERSCPFEALEHDGNHPENMQVLARDKVTCGLPEMEPLYRSANGDGWLLARDSETGLVFVRHQANPASGGQVTDIDPCAFLSGERHPEQEALLRLIGAMILDQLAVMADDEAPGAKTGGERSGVYLKELGDMLVSVLSIEEISRFLRRDCRELRDKIAEVVRTCRRSMASMSDRGEICGP